MPDDYYVSQYSGEEWDAMIAGVAGSVRYDAAQSLTTAQQAQARGNIDAAPNGYGLGSKYAKITTNWDDAKESGIYSGPAPSGIGSGPILGVTFSNGEIYKVQIVYPDAHSNCSAQREMPANGTWGEWEWVNPPMSLGVEYRTTERYLGKPVYVKAINFGAGPNASTKTVAHGVTNIDKAIRVWGNIDNYNLIGFSGVSAVFVGASEVAIKSSENLSARSIVICMAYTKTTD